MLKIDIHTHILPPKIPRFSDMFHGGRFIELSPCGKDHCADMVWSDGTLFRKVEANCFDASVRIKECDHAKVDVQVISTVPVMFNYHTKPAEGEIIAKFLNDHIHSVVQEHPKRFVGLGTLPMQSPSLAVRELERCRGDLGLAGVQIGSHINDWNLSDESLFPVFEAAEALGAAVFVHPWDMMGKERMNRYWLPWLVGMPAETSLAICSMIFGGVFRKFPKLKVAFAHGGGSFPMTVGRIDWGFQVRPDLCAVDDDEGPKKYLGKFWLDSLVHDGDVLDYVVKLIGPDKVCLGSDYPFPLGEDVAGKLIESKNYPEEIERNLLADSALNWLGLRREDYL